jgi:hypothetical protein
MSGELLTLAICASKAFWSPGSSGVKAAIRTPSRVTDLLEQGIQIPVLHWAQRDNSHRHTSSHSPGKRGA